MPSKDLELDFITGLLAEPEETKPKLLRNKKNTDTRTTHEWFHNPLVVHDISGTCSRGEDCYGVIEYDRPLKQVTALVNGIEMCRICFLHGVGLTNG